MGRILRFKMDEVFPDGICSALIPAGMFKCLFRCKNFDEPLRKAVEILGLSNVEMKRSGIELSKQVDFAVTGIDAV